MLIRPPINTGPIIGLTSVCQGQNLVTYTVSPILNASNYIWTLPTGATGTISSNTISVNYGTSAVSGLIKVKGNNNCGDGSEASLQITVNPLPDQAGVISGLTSVCQGQKNVTYTVPPINNATSYIWILPNGMSGSSTTNTITVNFGSSTLPQNISVKGHNYCGDGVLSNLTINIIPLPLVTITANGSAELCPGGSVTLNAGVHTSYLWNTGETTQTIVVNTTGN